MFTRLNKWFFFLSVAAFVWLPRADAMVHPMNSPAQVTAAITQALFPEVEQGALIVEDAAGNLWMAEYVGKNPYNGEDVYVLSPLGLQENAASCYNYDLGVFVGQRNLDKSYAEYNMLMCGGIRFASSDALTTYEASAGCLETLTAKTAVYGGAVMGGGVIVAGAVSTAPVWVPAVSVTATTLAYNQFAQAAFAGGVAGLVYAADRASSWSEAVGYTVAGAGTCLVFQYAASGAPGLRERIRQATQTWQATRPLGNPSGSVINPLAGRSVLRNPNTIRFSQDSIKAGFTDPAFGTIDDLAVGLKNGTITPSSVEPIRLVEREGNLISIDNRRLEAFRRAGVDIPTRMATPAEIEQAIRQGKFSAGELGATTIPVRGQ